MTVKRNMMKGILGGLAGFVVGGMGGGFLGLVLGGTYLGSLDLLRSTGLQGYELAAYMGIGIGVLILTPLGVKIALGSAAREKV